MHNYIHVYILCNICLMCGMSLELEVGDLYTWAQTLGGNWAWSTGSGGWDQRRASCYDIIIRLQEIYLVLRCTEIGLGVWSEFFCAGFWLVVMWRSRLCKHTRFTYNNHGNHAPTHTNQGENPCHQNKGRNCYYVVNLPYTFQSSEILYHSKYSNIDFSLKKDN